MKVVPDIYVFLLEVSLLSAKHEEREIQLYVIKFVLLFNMGTR